MTDTALATSLPVASGLPPLLPEQEQALEAAVQALGGIQRGFRDRLLPFGLGLHAARKAAWDAAEAESESSLRLPDGAPNWHADLYRTNFHSILTHYFGDYYMADPDTVDIDNDDEETTRANSQREAQRQKYRRDQRDALLFIVDNLHRPLHPRHASKPGFLPWYEAIQSEGSRVESASRLSRMYRVEILEEREPTIDSRAAKTKQIHELEQRVVAVEAEREALKELVTNGEVAADPKVYADAAIALGVEFVRSVHQILGKWLKGK